MSSISKKNWTKWHHLLHKELLNNKGYIPAGINMLLAVSGGQDSMAMLIIFNEIKQHHNWSLNVWHGDHKWHNKSTDYAKSLKQFCSQNNIPCFIDYADTVDVASEEKARNWRYEKLHSTAKKLFEKRIPKKDVYIATGHTSTDNIETFFLNLARGSYYCGLGGIPKKRMLNEKFFLVRPFLIFSRKDTDLICKSLNIPTWVDPSNLDLNIQRNNVRHNIIPVLEKIHPGCSHRISNFIQKMNSYKNEQADLCSLAIKSCTTKNGLNRQLLLSIGDEARSTIIFNYLKQTYSQQINSKQIKNISEKIYINSSGQVQLSNGFQVLWNQKFINILN